MGRGRLPFELSIPEPCAEDWDAMRDSGVARRYCQHCQTAVVDVALLTRAELQELVDRTAGGFCARLTRLPHGGLLMREEPEPSNGMAGLRTPLLAGAIVASSALGVASAQNGAHPVGPALSCAEMTDLQELERVRAGQPSPASGSQLAAAPLPAPVLPAPLRRTQAQVVTLGKPAIPPVSLHGKVRLPRGNNVRTGMVYAEDGRGNSVGFEIKPDGTYEGRLLPGTYRLRADVRAENGLVYAAVDKAVLTGEEVRCDLTLQGPVMVTAGAPAIAPAPEIPHDSPRKH